MKDIRIISGKRILPSLETVSALLGAKNTNMAQDRIRAAYEKLLPDVQLRIRPKAALVIDMLKLPADGKTEKKVLYAMLTIGDGIARLTEKLTAENDMIKAMTADAMADSCLFAFEEQILPFIKRLCLEEGYGIAGRLEMMQDVPAKVQRTAFDALKAERTLGLSITSGYMLKPEKSMSLIFELTEDTGMQCVEHNCKKCADKSCPLRKKQKLLLTVEQAASYSAGSLAAQIRKASPDGFSPQAAKAPGKASAAVRIFCPGGSNLMEVLRENAIALPAYCGGKGTCGKCGVLVKEGTLPITPEDRAVFSEDALQRGMRLSCRAILQGDVTVAVQKQEDAVLQMPETEEAFCRKNPDSTADLRQRCASGSYGIAIDIGTTTLAFSLTELSAGKITDTYTAVNSQRAFGADVLTRMQAANMGKGELLSRSIKHDILTGIRALIGRNSVKPAALKHIVIAANTVMMHLLRGYSCEGLGRHPFTPVTLETEELTLSGLYAGYSEDALQPFFPGQIKVTLLPGISAFVGADITAGLYACDILKADTAALFLDLGTNGEMALKKDGFLYTASAAAGPAFEAGNMKWGMPGIAGAISHVTLRNGRAAVKTIADRPPEGICGTGVIEAVAELCGAGLIDAAGKLKEPYFPEGFTLAETVQGEKIILQQQDIREIQMAKAAIRAGIEILMQRSGAQWEEIGQVYLAGGFGYFLDTEKAAAIGLLPKKLLSRTKPVGNTSLKGAQLFLLRQDFAALRQIRKNAREISLAQDESFQELYLSCMAF